MDETPPLTHNEIWDDSALIRSWDDALEEYKKYHSLHARGLSLEDVERLESERNGEEKSTQNTTLADLSTNAAEKGSERSREKEDERGDDDAPMDMDSDSDVELAVNPKDLPNESQTITEASHSPLEATKGASNASNAIFHHTTLSDSATDQDNTIRPTPANSDNHQNYTDNNAPSGKSNPKPQSPTNTSPSSQQKQHSQPPIAHPPLAPPMAVLGTSKFIHMSSVKVP